MPQRSLQQAIQSQRALLNDYLRHSLSTYVLDLPALLTRRDALDARLRAIFQTIEHCKYIYVLDANGVQLSSTINKFGADEEAIGRDRAERPYMQHIADETCDFNLSQAYISRNKKRPSLTAIQTIRNSQGQRLGFLGVDYDLRELPHSKIMYEEPSQWRQIKGDPAIRQGLFAQERVESLMDKQLDHVLAVHEALMVDQGVHHIQIHFSSSRSTLWHVDDPYVYRILTMDELADTDICFAYPRRPYFNRAIVPASDIGKILKQWKALRFADETIYLRSASLNIVNGKVSLNFSCDGTHYLHYDEFLSKGLAFWFGGTAQAAEACVPEPLDYAKLDVLIDELAGGGCIQVNKLLYAIEQQPDSVPERLQAFSPAERAYIYKELKAVMDVYDGGVCGI
jgi:hypothetical protein